MDKYKLVGHTPVRVDDLTEWAKAFERDRTVAQTRVGNLDVSTVFLGLDHNFFNNGPPLLFETMIFGDGEEYQVRCSTWEEAELQHAAAVAEAKRRLS